MALHYKDNRDYIINYDIRVYSIDRDDRFYIKPLSDRLELVDRFWFPECFEDKHIYEVLTESEFHYLWKNYYEKAIKDNIIYIGELIYNKFLPYFNRLYEIINSIIHPVECINYKGDLTTAVMDVSLNYGNLENSNFNFCIGALLSTFYNIIFLDNKFFLIHSNLFNDFSFFDYFQKDIEHEPKIAIKHNFDFSTQFDYTFFNIVKWIGSSIWEYYFGERKYIYSHDLHGLITEDNINFLSKIKEGDGQSIQEVNVSSLLDTNYLADVRRDDLGAQIKFLAEFNKYESKLNNNIEYFKSYLDIKIDKKKIINNLFYYYCTYRYLAILLRGYTWNDFIEILILVEDAFFLQPMREDLKGKYALDEPIFKLVVVNLRTKKKHILVHRDRMWLNYLWYNLIINRLVRFFRFISFDLFSKTEVFGFLDLIGYSIIKPIKFFYNVNYLENLLTKKVLDFYKKTDKYLKENGYIKEKSGFKVIEDTYPEGLKKNQVAVPRRTFDLEEKTVIIKYEIYTLKPKKKYAKWYV